MYLWQIILRYSMIITGENNIYSSAFYIEYIVCMFCSWRHANCSNIWIVQSHLGHEWYRHPLWAEALFTKGKGPRFNAPDGAFSPNNTLANRSYRQAMELAFNSTLRVFRQCTQWGKLTEMYKENKTKRLSIGTFTNSNGHTVFVIIGVRQLLI